jgi:hypothetical protein
LCLYCEGACTRHRVPVHDLPVRDKGVSSVRVSRGRVTRACHAGVEQGRKRRHAGKRQLVGRRGRRGGRAVQLAGNVPDALHQQVHLLQV